VKLHYDVTVPTDVDWRGICLIELRRTPLHCLNPVALAEG